MEYFGKEDLQTLGLDKKTIRSILSYAYKSGFIRRLELKRENNFNKYSKYHLKDFIKSIDYHISTDNKRYLYIWKYHKKIIESIIKKRNLSK